MSWFKRKEKKAEVQVIDVNKEFIGLEKTVSVFTALKQKVADLQHQLNQANVKIVEKDKEIERLNILLNKLTSAFDDIKKVR